MEQTEILKVQNCDKLFVSIIFFAKIKLLSVQIFLWIKYGYSFIIDKGRVWYKQDLMSSLSEYLILHPLSHMVVHPHSEHVIVHLHSECIIVHLHSKHIVVHILSAINPIPSEHLVIFPHVEPLVVYPHGEHIIVHYHPLRVSCCISSYRTPHQRLSH